VDGQAIEVQQMHRNALEKHVFELHFAADSELCWFQLADARHSSLKVGNTPTAKDGL
jgi:hypothetical protein